MERILKRTAGSRAALTLVTPLALIATLGVGLPARVEAAPATQAGQPQTWTVLVGGQSTPEQKSPTQMPAGAWQYMRFYPDKITVHVGDTVVWKLNADIHQVVFPPAGQNYVPIGLPPAPGAAGPPAPEGNPQAFFPQGGPLFDGTSLAGSGNMSMTAPDVQEYRLLFTKAGSFSYLCPLHAHRLPSGEVEGMTGQVTVVDAGGALDKAPADVVAEAKALLAADDKAAQAAEGQAKQAAPPSVAPDGTMVYHGSMGWDVGALSYMRFFPEDFTIHVGDAVEWTQTSSDEAHTVSLFSGAKEPPFYTIQPQPSGPAKVLVNVQALAPSGGPTYDGTGITSSGNIPGTKSPRPGPRTYRLQFTKPGTFEYVCIFHDEMGMSGHVTVLAAETAQATATAGAPVQVPAMATATPAGGTPGGMPRTGNGDEGLWLVALAGAASLTLAGLTLRRARAQ